MPLSYISLLFSILAFLTPPSPPPFSSSPYFTNYFGISEGDSDFDPL